MSLTVSRGLGWGLLSSDHGCIHSKPNKTYSRVVGQIAPRVVQLVTTYLGDQASTGNLFTAVIGISSLTIGMVISKIKGHPYDVALTVATIFTGIAFFFSRPSLDEEILSTFLIDNYLKSHPQAKDQEVLAHVIHERVEYIPLTCPSCSIAETMRENDQDWDD